jgi:hypothetical protein
MMALGRKAASLLAAGLLAVAGCSFQPAGLSPVHDGGGGQPDAAPDARPDAGPTAARTQREIVSGGGHLTGGTMTLDVQIGHPVGQGPATGGTQTIEGGAAVKP